MKKRLTIALMMLLVFQLGAQAQRQYRKPLRSQSEGNLAMSNYTIGLKGGCPWGVILDSDLTKVTYKGYFGYSGGIVVERFFPRFSIALEGIYSKKGTAMQSVTIYQSSLEGVDKYDTINRNYQYSYSSVAVRIPVTYYLKGVFPNNVIVPYIFIGPQIEFQLPFIDTPEYHITSDFGNTTYSSTLELPFNVSVIGGVGLMTHIPLDGYPITVKLDVGANYGLRNLSKSGFSVLPDENGKSIRAHDIEANITVLLPIKKILRDACYYIN